MNTNNKKLKVLYQIHWCVNIAPKFNGVTPQPIKPYSIREETTNSNIREGGWFTIITYTVIGWRRIGKAPYSLNLVYIKNRLIERYNLIK